MDEKGTQVLIGWKQIAAYLRCAVSTARRQARGKGLPVFRVGGSVRANVEDHRDILAALRAGDGRTAERLIQQHIIHFQRMIEQFL